MMSLSQTPIPTARKAGSTAFAAVWVRRHSCRPVMLACDVKAPAALGSMLRALEYLEGHAVSRRCSGRDEISALSLKSCPSQQSFCEPMLARRRNWPIVFSAGQVPSVPSRKAIVTVALAMCWSTTSSAVAAVRLDVAVDRHVCYLTRRTAQGPRQSGRPPRDTRRHGTHVATPRHATPHHAVATPRHAHIMLSHGLILVHVADLPQGISCMFVCEDFGVRVICFSSPRRYAGLSSQGHVVTSRIELLSSRDNVASPPGRGFES